MKTIDAKQKEALLAFTKAHYVKYADLQVELVKLLSQDIEAQWKQNPALSFDHALDIAFKKWGVFGFSNFVDEQGAIIYKRYLCITSHQLVSHFKGKKLFQSVLVYVLFASFLRIMSKDIDWFMATVFGIILVGLISSFYISYKTNKKNKLIPVRFLYHDVIQQRSMSFPYLITFLACQVGLNLHLPEKYFSQPWFIPISAGFILLLMVFQYDCSVIIPKLALNEFENQQRH